MTPVPTSKGTTLQLRRTVAASREAVFRAWTDPDWFKQWFRPPEGSTPHADLDVRVGGDYRIEMRAPEGTGYLFGQYLEVKRPERLVYTFCWDGWSADIPETQVTVEFHDRGDATEIVLTHERNPSRRVREIHEWGWTNTLAQLVDLLGEVSDAA
jgi:uncharacterized protein YndB with AHSA1/START domain